MSDFSPGDKFRKHKAGIRYETEIDHLNHTYTIHTFSIVFKEIPPDGKPDDRLNVEWESTRFTAIDAG